VKANDVFPGSYLKAEDLGTNRPVVTIERVESEKIGDDQRRVVYFSGKEKGLMANKTNWNTIADITGEDDDDNWAGHRIRLFVTKTEYQGKRVPCIRVEEAPVSAAPAKAKSKPEPEPDFEVGTLADDSEIPF
jgi:hypothetical protein